MAKRDEGKTRKWTRLNVLSSFAIMLTICSWSPSRGQERHGTCEEEGETLAIYDCQTRLVLWARRQPGQIPPMVPPEGELCRLVAPSTQPMQASGQCL